MASRGAQVGSQHNDALTRQSLTQCYLDWLMAICFCRTQATVTAVSLVVAFLSLG